MPEITVAAGIPCPQTSTVSPVDRRLLTEGNHPRMQARTIELDERQIQTFAWALNTAQAAAFRQWWTTDLIYGGAWWSAPDTWPTPEGYVVKVRRFIEAPAWQYLGAGNWNVSAVCEVRGRTLLPSEPVVIETEFDVLVRSGDMSVMLYREQYEIDFPDLVAWGPILSSSGSELEVYAVDEVIRGVHAPNNSVGSARTSSIELEDDSEIATVVEFEILGLPFEGEIGVGIFCAAFGPPGSNEAWLLGTQSLCVFLTSTGAAGGYGESHPSTGITFEVGDVIGFVALGESQNVFIYKNGVGQELVLPLGSDTDLQAFVSFRMVE